MDNSECCEVDDDIKLAISMEVSNKLMVILRVNGMALLFKLMRWEIEMNNLYQ